MAKHRNAAVEIPSYEQVTAERERLNKLAKKRRKRWIPFAVFLSSIGIAVLLSMFVLSAFQVYNNTMSPTLQSGDIVVAAKPIKLSTGDVVAVKLNERIVLRRVIGLPGDKIDFDANGILLLNGEILREEYLSDRTRGDTNQEYPYTVPQDKYFVLGDTRSTAVDSRRTEIDSIEKEKIIGHVRVRVWPITKLSWIS